MAMRDILDRQAGTIEYVLHTHGIRAQADGGKLSPRLAHFHLVLPPGFNPSRLGHFIPDLADALGVTTCRLSAGESGVYLEVPRPDPVPVRLLPIVQRVADVVPPATATLGLDCDSTPLLMRLNSPDVDPVLVTGEAGSGKSSLLRNMALSLALHNSPDTLKLLLLDCHPEGATFRGLEMLPHLPCPVASGPVDSLLSLRWALRALDRRASLTESDELTFDDEEEDDLLPGEPLFEYAPLQAQLARPCLIIIVSGADLLCRPGQRAQAEAVPALRRLLLNGSRQDIRLVLSAERLDLLGVNAGWGARIVGRVSSPDQARLATGMRGSGAQGLLGGGDFLVNLNSELIRFQAASISPTEIARAVDLIRSCAANYPQPNAEETFAPRPSGQRSQTRNGRDSEPTPLSFRRGRAVE